MKVIIFTEAGSAVGLGHWTRCAALGQEFLQNGQEVMAIINGPARLALSSPGIKIQYLNWLRDDTDIWQMILPDDLVIIDSYLASLDVYRLLAAKVKPNHRLYFDDANRINYPAGIILNTAPLAQQLQYPRSSGKTYLLGSKYYVVNAELRAARKFHVRHRLQRVLITFGASDAKNLAPIMLGVINEFNPQWQKTVVVGKFFAASNIKRLRQLVNAKTKLVFDVSGKKMKQLMCRTDVAISASGQTLYELAYLSVPTIAICENEAQRMNITGWQQNGWLKQVIDVCNKDFQKQLVDSLQKLNAYSVRQRLSKIGKGMVDDAAGRRILKCFKIIS